MNERPSLRRSIWLWVAIGLIIAVFVMGVHDIGIELEGGKLTLEHVFIGLIVMVAPLILGIMAGLGVPPHWPE